MGVAILVAAAGLVLSLQAAAGGVEVAAAVSAPMGPPAPQILSRMEVNEAFLAEGVRERAIAFYTARTGNEEITNVIISHAVAHNIPVNLAFSLAWQESRYNPRAISGRNYYGTRDWGLFQLNDGGRPDWRSEDFFDIEKNASTAMAFLRYCIDEMGGVRMGLAAYNAGVYGVRQWGVPASTKRHIHAILGYEKELDRAFSRQVAWRF
jgi:soluble lytic murein transglycosylase-like protein